MRLATVCPWLTDKFTARTNDDDLSIVVPLNARELRVAYGDIKPPADAILVLVKRRALLARPFRHGRALRDRGRFRRRR